MCFYNFSFKHNENVPITVGLRQLLIISTILFDHNVDFNVCLVERTLRLELQEQC